ncbi:MAG: FUSC family protein [Pseudomonadota bacterium]|nr:FUSC family protein [Pseudomonadota bacterium]
MDIFKRLPSYILNGVAVAVGIGLIQLLISTVAGSHAAHLALSGAVCASLADQPLPAARTWHRVSAAVIGSVLATAIVEALRPHPLLIGVAIAAITWLAMMAQAWGPRAGAVSFAPILAIVFALASPAGADALVVTTGWNAAGAACYLAWSMACAAVLAPRYRRLALVDALAATAELLRARATLIETPHADPAATTAFRAWVAGEAVLAERLQAARDFVFVDALATKRPAAMLLLAIDLRDALLASRLDLERLEGDAAGRWLLGQTAVALRHTASQVDAAALLLIWGGTAHSRAAFDVDGLYADAPFSDADPRRRLLPALRLRTRVLDDIALHIITLAQSASAEPAAPPLEALPLTAAQLQRFIAPEGWPLRVVGAQLRWTSPVARHAVRAALALSLAYLIGLWLPWASHPHWLVLSVAVVLRGNLEQTLSRRNARVLGTLVGCAVVLPISALHAPPVLAGVFLLAVGTAHAFLNRRYWLTATAATVMALLQSHAVDPAAGFALAERAADTVIGALLAWGFSYVLPSWERRRLPASLRSTLKDLNDYAGQALKMTAEDAVESRLARRRAYDALGNLAAALQRSRAEPRGVQVPLAAVAALLDHGQRLMAELSVLRLILARGLAAPQAVAGSQLLLEARTALRGRFDLATPALALLPEAELTDDQALRILPVEAPEADLLPWLQHRLRSLVRDAQRVRSATDDLLQVLQAGVPPGS